MAWHLKRVWTRRGGHPLSSCFLAAQRPPESSPNCHTWSDFLCPFLDPVGTSDHPGSAPPLPDLLGPPACFHSQLDAPPPRTTPTSCPLLPEHLSLIRSVVSKSAVRTMVLRAREENTRASILMFSTSFCKFLFFVCCSMHKIY